MRSLDDVKAWFSQPYTGTIETAGAPWWRLLDRFAPDANVVVIRRPVDEVVESMMNVPGCVFDRDKLTGLMIRLDQKLDQIEARIPGVMSVRFEDLADEATCAMIFEHCLPYAHDSAWWQMMDAINVQIDMRAMLRHFSAYQAALDKLALVAKHQTLAALASRKPVISDGITIQTEDFDAWVKDGAALFDEHLVQVGEAPGDWSKKNIPLMRRLFDAGAMQITTARSNGRMFGYLMTLISPSLTSENITTGTHTTFYASSDCPGLGLKLQRAAMASLKDRGVDEVFMQAGVRGSGERIASIYRRLGAENNGQFYRLSLSEVI